MVCHSGKLHLKPKEWRSVHVDAEYGKMVQVQGDCMARVGVGSMHGGKQLMTAQQCTAWGWRDGIAME